MENQILERFVFRKAHLGVKVDIWQICSGNGQSLCNSSVNCTGHGQAGIRTIAFVQDFSVFIHIWSTFVKEVNGISLNFNDWTHARLFWYGISLI